MGAKKSSKNFQKTSKICEFPSLEPQNRVERCPKPSQTKTNQENPEPEEGSRTIEQQIDRRRAPPDGGALCAYRERILGNRKGGALPHRTFSTKHSALNTQQRRTPPHLYVSRRLNQLCTRSALQRPGSSCHGEPSQNDRVADHP